MRLDDITAADIDRFANKLSSWPSNGKPEMDDDVHMLKALGFVEEKEQMKNCPSCGTRQVDWRWLRITDAGKFFLKAATRLVG